MKDISRQKKGVRNMLKKGNKEKQRKIFKKIDKERIH